MIMLTPNLYEILADIVTATHVLLIVGVFVGIAISIKFKWFRPVESFILLIMIVIWSLYSGCPLTYLEDSLRIKAFAPNPITEIGFITYYTKTWFGTAVSEQVVITVTYFIAALFFLFTLESFHKQIGRYIKRYLTLN